jgi:hypothetical protein
LEDVASHFRTMGKLIDTVNQPEIAIRIDERGIRRVVDEIIRIVLRGGFRLSINPKTAF